MTKFSQFDKKILMLTLIHFYFRKQQDILDFENRKVNITKVCLLV